MTDDPSRISARLRRLRDRAARAIAGVIEAATGWRIYRQHAPIDVHSSSLSAFRDRLEAVQAEADGRVAVQMERLLPPSDPTKEATTYLTYEFELSVMERWGQTVLVLERS